MKKKSMVVFTILITIINTFMPVVNAVSEITKANLINSHKIDSHIMYYNEERKVWSKILCNYICYKHDEEKYPAYCITHGVNGVDQEGPYTVTIDKLLDNKLVYNTIINGYPYKTPEQLGLKTVDDAYVATKHAIKSAVLNRDVKSFYKATDERGEKIINAIYNISEKGKIGNATNKEAIININKVGDFISSGEYYYQEYKVTGNTEISKYTVKNIQNLIRGGYIADTNGIEKNTFSSGEKFRIMIPKLNFDKDIDLDISVVATCKTNSIFYGKAPKSNIQDYAITYDPYLEYKSSVKLNKATNTSSIKIIKKDAETSELIEDVLFGLYNENDKLITECKTNKDGILIFNNLYQGKYKIKEISTNENYIKDDMVHEVVTEFNKQTVKTITNVHKKGNLKITKIDKDDNLVVLDGIEFDLFNSNKEKVAHLITNEKGEANIENINIGKYTLKETKTKDNYKLCVDNDIEVKWNATSNVIIENEKKKGQIKIVKKDKENSEIKLEGVTFEIINSNNQVIDTIVTNKNGEALTKSLPIGEYIVKESSVGANTQYILEQTEYKIKVEDQRISEIVIENMHKKGNLKITKVDKDNPEITLGAIEFDLISENGITIAHLVTDVNGEAYIENINTGKYTLKETVSKREYNLCENKDIVVEWNETSEIVIENEKKKGQIKVIKEDIDKNEIKLAGIKFQILNKRDEIIEEIMTNEMGEAMSSRLIVGEYKIKELDLGKNIEYLLNNEIYSLQVEDEKVSQLVIQNEHKKGSLNILKVDKDNNDLRLVGVKFKVTDEDGFVYEAVTDNNGIARIDNIRVGNVKIKELETNENYVLTKEKYETKIEYNRVSEIKIENEKKKGQVEILKVDKENKTLKIAGVEFEILDLNNNLIDRIITDIEGYAISKKLPIGKYYLKEARTNNKYILDNRILEIEINTDKILALQLENKKIKGKIKIIKSSSNDSQILNLKKGDNLSNVVFEIFDDKGELVDTIVTDDQGEAVSKSLEIGRYKVKEKSTLKYYILNTNEFFVNIDKNNEIEILEIKNEAVIPKLDIEKKGQQFAEKNDEIKYEFDIKNESNIKLNNFVWTEYIPYQYSKLSKMITGTYNENLDYEIYYKTNKNNYKLLKKANTLISEYINFDNLKLSTDEIIIELKVEYKTVSNNFNSIAKPVLFTKLDGNIRKGNKILNITKLSGVIDEYYIEDKSCFETIITEKEKIKKLPKTGC